MSDFSNRKTVQLDHREDAPQRQRASHFDPNSQLTKDAVCAWNGVILKIGMRVTVNVRGEVISASISCINGSLQLDVVDSDGNVLSVFVSDIVSVV